MTTIETKKDLPENEALILTDKDATRAEFPNVKVEPETEEPIKEWDETAEVKKETKLIWEESDLEAMGYKGKVTKIVRKNGKQEKVIEEINSRSEYKKNKITSQFHTWFNWWNVENENIIDEQSPRDVYYKENPSVKEKRNDLKYKTGKYLKESISQIDGVWDAVNSFYDSDFQSFFKFSFDGKAVNLDLWNRQETKTLLAKYIEKVMKSWTLGTMVSRALSPEEIADSIVYNNPVTIDTLLAWSQTIVNAQEVNNIRANIKYAFRTTFDKLKEDWYEVWDREKDFEKAFWSN